MILILNDNSEIEWSTTLLDLPYTKVVFQLTLVCIQLNSVLIIVLQNVKI